MQIAEETSSPIFSFPLLTFSFRDNKVVFFADVEVLFSARNGNSLAARLVLLIQSRSVLANSLLDHKMYRYNIVNHNLSIFFCYDVFLHCFFQRHVSALVMSHLHVDHFFLARYTIQLAMVIVWFTLPRKSDQP